MTIDFVIGFGVVFGAFAVTALLGWIVTGDVPDFAKQLADLEARVAMLEAEVARRNRFPFAGTPSDR